MEGKKVADTRVAMAQIMIPRDANPAGNIHGGVIVRLIDNAAYVVATRHARTNVVTASIDRVDFHNPVYVGNLVHLRASVNMVGTTSMEIGVKVEAEDLRSGEIRHTASAYLTYVALDENGKPTQVPPLLLETDEEKRRNQEALERKKAKLRNG